MKIYSLLPRAPALFLILTLSLPAPTFALRQTGLEESPVLRNQLKTRLLAGLEETEENERILRFGDRLELRGREPVQIGGKTVPVFWSIRSETANQSVGSAKFSVVVPPGRVAVRGSELLQQDWRNQLQGIYRNMFRKWENDQLAIRRKKDPYLGRDRLTVLLFRNPRQHKPFEDELYLFTLEEFRQLLDRSSLTPNDVQLAARNVVSLRGISTSNSRARITLHFHDPENRYESPQVIAAGTPSPAAGAEESTMWGPYSPEQHARGLAYLVSYYLTAAKRAGKRMTRLTTYLIQRPQGRQSLSFSESDPAERISDEILQALQRVGVAPQKYGWFADTHTAIHSDSQGSTLSISAAFEPFDPESLGKKVPPPKSKDKAIEYIRRLLVMYLALAKHERLTELHFILDGIADVAIPIDLSGEQEIDSSDTLNVIDEIAPGLLYFLRQGTAAQRILQVAITELEPEEETRTLIVRFRPDQTGPATGLEENLLVSEAVDLIMQRVKRGRVDRVQRGSVTLTGADLTKANVDAEARAVQLGGWLQIQFEKNIAKLLPPIPNQAAGLEEGGVATLSDQMVQVRMELERIYGSTEGMRQSLRAFREIAQTQQQGVAIFFDPSSISGDNALTKAMHLATLEGNLQGALDRPQPLPLAFELSSPERIQQMRGRGYRIIQVLPKPGRSGILSDHGILLAAADALVAAVWTRSNPQETFAFYIDAQLYQGFGELDYPTFVVTLQELIRAA